MRHNSDARLDQIKNRVCINGCPTIVKQKSSVGDCEIDLVMGEGHSGALVTIIDRVISFAVSKQVNIKLAGVVTAAKLALLPPLCLIGIKEYQ